MNASQLTEAVQDIREMLNEVYNEHAEMKAKIHELRVIAGLESPLKEPEIPIPAQ